MNIEDIAQMGEHIRQLQRKSVSYDMIADLFRDKRMVNMPGVDSTTEVTTQVRQLVEMLTYWDPVEGQWMLDDEAREVFGEA